jgi:hypothetical protein
MKKILSTLFLLGSLIGLKAQSTDTSATQKIGGYRLEKDEVVFVFNPNEHSDFITSYGMWRSKNNVKVKEVTLCGEFNSWMTTAKNYQMTKVGEVYEYRMKLSDFKGKSKVEFKFVVNEKYWAEPKTSFTNLTQSMPEFTIPKNFILNLVQPETN